MSHDTVVSRLLKGVSEKERGRDWQGGRSSRTVGGLEKIKDGTVLQSGPFPSGL